MTNKIIKCIVTVATLLIATITFMRPANAAKTSIMSTSNYSNNVKKIYQDSTISIDDRVEDLLNRMTLEEKVGQMNQFVGIMHMEEAEETMTVTDLNSDDAHSFYPGVNAKDVYKLLKKGHIGSFLHVFTPQEANKLQHVAMKSRLQIPIIFGIDAIHGNAYCPGNTVYPTSIGLASSFDTTLAYTIARQTAEEMRSMSMHWTFNPNVEVARDARWGRCGETFGESPYLVGAMGASTVRGYQRNLDNDTDVLACIKHFVGGSQPINGLNAAPADISENTARNIFFPPFKKCVDAGAMSIMMSHNELNGVPCHANRWLMEDVLRKEWKFNGFVVSDWMDIEKLYTLQHTATSIEDAYYQSIMAGMDLHMHGPEWNAIVQKLVEDGKVPESRIDQSVKRILRIKFRLGLFEHPYCNIEKSKKVRLSPEHRASALEASRKSIVLLKNDGILPLDASKYKHVLVTGINADDQNIMGDWSAHQADKDVITILEGLRNVEPNVDFDFVDQGWDPRNMDSKKVDMAVSHAEKADLNIVVAGEYEMRERWDDRTCGENTDRDNLQLVGLQNELIERLYKTGKPTVLVLVSGRPLATTWAAEHLPALVEAWEPGMSGGQAVAEILYGKVNPSAKLSMTIPRSVGQIHTYFNYKPAMFFHPVACGTTEPLYHFGYGLSYSEFEYSNICLDKKEISKEGSVKVSFDLKNTSDREGTEVVQLYIRDDYSTVTRPVKELRDFKRVNLKAGESQKVIFTLPASKLAYYNGQMKYVIEPGTFHIMVGSSSRDKDLMSTILTVK